MTGGELGRSWKSFGGDRGGECGERDAAGNKAWADNTLWAVRASFKIRRLRRLSRGSADPRES